MARLDQLDPRTRRWLIRRSLQLTGLALMGCTTSGSDSGGSDGDSGSGSGDGGSTDGGGTDGGNTDGGSDTGAQDCPDPFADGTLLAVLDWQGEPDRDLEELTGQGLDARYVLDLASLDDDSLVVPNDRFYVRTGKPDLLPDTDGWVIRVRGLDDDLDLALDDLADLAHDQGVVLMECSGNTDYGGFGLMSAARWGGILFADLLALIGTLPDGARVLVSGFDDHSQPSTGSSVEGASWVFTPEQLIDAGAFLATSMNGAPLRDDHGFPIRLVVPGWYGCCCIKWVDEIRFVGADQPATGQMQEFASRTHQDGVPALAADYLPAEVDQVAAPIRVEQWQLDGEIVYRVVGLLWGGRTPTDALTIIINGGDPQPVTLCPPHDDNRTWRLWTWTWTDAAPGRAVISMAIDDPTVQTRRLDSGWYDREVVVPG